MDDEPMEITVTSRPEGEPQQSLTAGAPYEATSYEVYVWDCPVCEAVNEEGDVQPAGEIMTCYNCGAKVWVN